MTRRAAASAKVRVEALVWAFFAATGLLANPIARCAIVQRLQFHRSKSGAEISESGGMVFGVGLGNCSFQQLTDMLMLPRYRIGE
jgi:hypothetical protein